MSDFDFFETIARLDIFGSKIDLQFKNKKKHQTTFGGFITLINIAVLVYVSISYSNKLFDKTKPSILFSEENVKQPETYNLTESAFSMTFGLENSKYTHYIDESIYTIEVSQFSSNTVFNEKNQQYEQKIEIKNIEVSQCKPENFKVEGTQDYFKKMIDIGQLYCLNQTINNAWIGGDFTAEQFGFIEFKIFQCTNKTEEEKIDLISKGKEVIQCQSKEQIDSALTNTVFSVQHTDKIFNPTDFDKPFTTITRDIFWPLSNQLVKQLNMYFRNVYVESESGIMQREIIKQRDVVFSFQTEQVIYGKKNQFASLVIRPEKNKQSRYYRTYGQIEDIIAQISGVMNFIVLISAFICLRMSQLDLSKHLANEVFTFYDDEQNEQQQKNDKATKKNIEIEKLINELNNSQKLQQFNSNVPVDDSILQIDDKNLSSNRQQQAKQNHNEIISKYIKTFKKSITSQTCKTHKEQKKFKDLISQLFLVTKSTLKLKAYEYILYYIFPCWKGISKKKRQINYSQQQLDKHLDAMYIVNKLQEIDKLKMLLLSEDQIKLFNYLPKPTIKIDDIQENKNQNIQQSINVNQNLNNSQDIQHNQQQLSSSRQAIKNKYSYVEKFNMLYMDERSDIEKASDAYTAFDKIRKLQCRTNIDTKLLLMLDHKILDFFLDDGEMDIYHDILKYEESSPQQIDSDIWKSRKSVFCQDNQFTKQQKLDQSKNLNQQIDQFQLDSNLNLQKQQSKYSSPYEATEIIHNIKEKYKSDELQICIEENNFKQEDEILSENQVQSPVSSDFHIPSEDNPNKQFDFIKKRLKLKNSLLNNKKQIIN